MEAADGDGQPPAPLRLAWMCGDARLPDAGGVYDQDYAMMRQMMVTDNVYRTLKRLRNLKGAQIHSLTDSERKVIRYLRDEELL